MVSNQIMKAETLYSLPLQLIDEKCLEQFVVGILNWYQSYEPVHFWESGVSGGLPNVFHLLEYPNRYSDYIVNLFIESGVYTSARKFGMKDLDRITIEELVEESFYADFEHLYVPMLSDIQRVLDAYHLFYFYQDDAQGTAHFFNPYITEVW